jgi:gliding motility-associated-like protein
MPYSLGKFSFLVLSLLFLNGKLHAQCSVQNGPPPPDHTFNSAENSGSNYISPGANDINWQIAEDSINALYKPAVVMDSLDPIYYGKYAWISFSKRGEHSGNKYFFYKHEFELPCSNLCGKSYNDENSFCLNLDLYADNSIYEIYVNGVPQSPNLGGVIPLANPFNPDHTQSEKTQVQLCKNWKPGPNTIIIQVASSATVAGMMVQVSFDPPPPPDSDTITVSVCEGESYRFADKDLTNAGYYFHSFPRNSGCDSNVVLHLDVKQKLSTVVNQSICEGQSYMGYTQSGTYTNLFTASSGCDSAFTLNLNVQEKPRPDLGRITAICDGDSIVLSPGTFNSYLWQDGSAGDHYVVRKPGVYSVTATNSCGTGSSLLVIKKGVCNIYFPNAFTPNADGKNDYFKILTDYLLQEYHLIIYNRWGQKVFETSDRSHAWDGKLNGKDLDTGVYVWYCTFKRSGIRSDQKGTVTLIR